jgi:hypothetical protein
MLQVSGDRPEDPDPQNNKPVSTILSGIVFATYTSL